VGVQDEELLGNDQQALLDANDDPLPEASPPSTGLTSSQLQRQLISDMETISVISARSEHNLSSMSKGTLNTSAISAGSRSMQQSIYGNDNLAYKDPPPYENAAAHDFDTSPNPSAGFINKNKKPKPADRSQVYKKQNDGEQERKPPSTKDMPAFMRIPKVSEQDRFIHCKVCHAFINVKNKLHQSVVRCSHCREATAIKAAPPGKQYVRCPCDCLLVCKSNSSRIMCPRANCNRTITIVKKQQPPMTASQSNVSQHSMTNHSQSKLSNNMSAHSQQTGHSDTGYGSRSAHSISQIAAYDDTQVHSPYSERRRNPAYESNTSLNQLDLESRGHHGRQRGGRKDSNGSSTAGLLAGLSRGTSAMGRETTRVHNPMNRPRLVRLQCAFCHMEFVRMTPLTSYGTCPHCETSMPFGNRYKRIRQWIFSLLAIVTLATALTLQLTKVLDPSGSNSQFNLMFIGLYILTTIFIIIVIRYSCMKVTHISESEL